MNSPFPRLGLLSLSALFACVPARAGLEFESRMVRREIEPRQSVLPVAFTFTNTGEKTVSIERVKPHCPCTEARVEGGSAVAPGRSGRILLVVDTRTFTGTVSKDVSVYTSDGVEHRLVIRVMVKELLAVRPKGLAWKQGGPAETKTVTIVLTPDCPFRLKRVSLVGDAFDYEPSTVTPGVRYAVAVIPKDTGRRIVNRLLIETDSGDPRYARIPVFLSIHPAAR